MLVRVREAQSIAVLGILLRARIQFDFAGPRYKQHVQQVPYSGTTEVGMAESQHRVVAVVIAGAPVPFTRPRIWTQLHCTERNRGSGKCVSVASRTGRDT